MALKIKLQEQVKDINKEQVIEQNKDIEFCLQQAKELREAVQLLQEQVNKLKINQEQMIPLLTNTFNDKLDGVIAEEQHVKEQEKKKQLVENAFKYNEEVDNDGTNRAVIPNNV